MYPESSLALNYSYPDTNTKQPETLSTPEITRKRPPSLRLPTKGSGNGCQHSRSRPTRGRPAYVIRQGRSGDPAVLYSSTHKKERTLAFLGCVWRLSFRFPGFLFFLFIRPSLFTHTRTQPTNQPRSTTTRSSVRRPDDPRAPCPRSYVVQGTNTIHENVELRSGSVYSMRSGSDEMEAKEEEVEVKVKVKEKDEDGTDIRQQP